MKKEKNNKGTSQKKWLGTIFISTFLLSAIFNMLSTQLVENLNNMIVSVILLIIVMAVGIGFDIIGTAVTAADEIPFHAMASDKKRGAKQSIKLIKNADKVANVCSDVVGDICGVLSGATGALIATNVAKMLNQNDITLVTLLVAATVTAFTVWFKGLFKQVAIRNCNSIIKNIGIFLAVFSK